MTRRILLTVTLCSLLAGGPSLADPGGESPPEETVTPYAVVLRDGSRLPARSKPISAFGKVRFVDEDGRTRVLAVAAVDLEATRRHTATVPDRDRHGTLSVTGGTVTVTSATPGPAAAGPEPTATETPPTRTVTVYSATWCGYCQKLKAFLRAERIDAEIIEVDLLPADQQRRRQAEMKGLTGRVAYPTVVIGRAATAGFSEEWIRAQLGR